LALKFFMWFLPTNPNNLGPARDFVHVPFYSGYQAIKHGWKSMVEGVKGGPVGITLGNIPDRMYPTNKSLFRDRKVISMPGKLEFKKKVRVIRHRSRYLRQRYSRRRNKFLL